MKTTVIDHYRFLKVRQILQYILNLLTLGLFQFAMNRPNFRRWFLYRKATPSDFDHVEVRSKIALTNKFSPVAEAVIVVNGREFQARVFTFDRKRYFIDPDNPSEAHRIKFRLEKMVHNHILANLSEGIAQAEVPVLLTTYGPNRLDFKIPGILQILKHEIFSFVYYFQIFAIIVWIVDDYLYFCLLLIFMTMLSLFFVVREVQAQMAKIRQKLLVGCPVIVHRRNAQGTLLRSEIQSDELMPGDLVEIHGNCTLQADIVVVKGSCLVNEAMLSGESRLIQKNPINNDREKFRKIELSSILFAGSKVEETFDSQVLGVVWRTSFDTLNGKMIKSVLTPKHDKCQIEKDLNWFLVLVLALGILGALSYLIYYFASDQDATGGKMVMRCLELITTLVPAFLPLCLAQSNYYGMKRMEKGRVTCSSHNQLNIAGSVRSVFFDKTGTITENDLTLKSYAEVGPSGTLVEVRPADFAALTDPYKMAVSTCHSLCELTSLQQGRTGRGPPRARNVPLHQRVSFQGEHQPNRGQVRGDLVHQGTGLPVFRLQKADEFVKKARLFSTKSPENTFL